MESEIKLIFPHRKLVPIFRSAAICVGQGYGFQCNIRDCGGNKWCDALADLLQEKPLDKITVTDVVRRAGINRGTFYAHYMDISDVIQHLYEICVISARNGFADCRRC